MKEFKNLTFDVERSFYGSEDVRIINCSFDGEADGESALKECRNIEVEHCFWNLRYPFWHDSNLKIKDTELTELCRAALWYSNQVEITSTKLHGIKALRECSDVRIEDCSIISPEFGWSVRHLDMRRSRAESEYFLMRGKNLELSNVEMKGKYSFQYVENAELEYCDLNTKDAFWHAKNVTVKNSTIKGEYLAWYSDGLTLINCKIIGTQPFCYCRNLKLIDCEMIDTDLAFEKSEVEAVITTPVISIKNPLAGCIKVPSVDQIIMDDQNAKGQIIQTENNFGDCQKSVCA